MKNVRSSLAVGLAAATLAAGTIGCGPATGNTHCHREADEVYPDEGVATAERAGDLLESYFGELEGELKWAGGATARITFDVTYELGSPYRLSNVYQCEPSNIYYDAPTYVRSGDGAFDQSTIVSLGTHFPGAGPGAIRETVAHFSGIPEHQWQAPLPARLGVTLERYESPYVLFEIDWPSGTAAPAGGRLLFNGALAVAPETTDRIEVATLSF